MTNSEVEAYRGGNAGVLSLIERIPFAFMEMKRHFRGGLAVVTKFVVGLLIVADVLWAIFTWKGQCRPADRLATLSPAGSVQPLQILAPSPKF